MRKKGLLGTLVFFLCVFLCSCLMPDRLAESAVTSGSEFVSEKQTPDSGLPEDLRDTEKEAVEPTYGEKTGQKYTALNYDGGKEESVAKVTAKAEAERIAKEEAKAEAERIAKEEAKAEAEQIAKEAAKVEAERIAKEEAKVEAERIAKEEAKAEAERIAKEEAKAEAEQIAKEEAKAEAEQIAKTEAERVVSQNVTGDAGLELVNSVRAQAGLGPLVNDDTLKALATVRAVEVSGVWGHTRPDGSSCFTILDDNGVSYSICGENIAAGHTSVTDAVNSWLNSTGHRANILNGAYNKMGIGLYTCEDEYGYYWVQIFTN